MVILFCTFLLTIFMCLSTLLLGSCGQFNNSVNYNPTENNPTENNPTENNPTENNPTENNPTENNPTENNPTENNPTEQKVNFADLKYVALGDSITVALDGITHSGMPEPYCNVVQKLLGLKSVKNYGISGSTICTSTKKDFPFKPMCERYNEMEDADIVSVMGGTNDWGRHSPLGTIDDNCTDTFYGALNVLAQGLKIKYPHAFIFFMTPLRCKQYEGLLENSDFDDFRQAVKDVCAKYDIPVLDTANLADFSQEFNAPHYSGDGVHPSQDFHHNILAPIIVQFLKDNYKPQ